MASSELSYTVGTIGTCGTFGTGIIVRRERFDLSRMARPKVDMAGSLVDIATDLAFVAGAAADGGSFIVRNVD